MNEAARRDHWETVYGSRIFTDVSWFQPRPERSLQMIEQTAVDREEAAKYLRILLELVQDRSDPRYDKISTKLLNTEQHLR